MMKNELKTLLCYSRIRILKSLGERRKTVSELSKELKLSKSTIHEHLTKLREIGLVEKRTNPNRKWVYYELTDRGYRFLRSELWKLIALTSSVVTILVGIVEIREYMTAKPAFVAMKVERTVDYTPLIIGVLLICIGVLVIAILFYKTERFR